MKKTFLSVNINKVALLRNSRGQNLPDVRQVALDCENYGAEGITIHPRPDERHIKYEDARQLKPAVSTELNIEGYPSERFLDLVDDVVPHQCTLVPDDPSQLTSDHGWDTKKDMTFLQEVISRLKEKGIRTSLFIDPDPALMASAKKTGADRIELYTGPYAKDYTADPHMAVSPYVKAAEAALEVGLGINAGHDLNLDNLRFFYLEVPGLQEVSIGHALISDALYYGLSNVIKMYKSCLRPTIGSE